ncbi:MAG TPA: hypothetical protein VGQ53_10525 [Chitinophagaceae bacterium]|jgi:hypothetical protein|nr:hypothetical protein [Chitinophagaceae bacterium]
MQKIILLLTSLWISSFCFSQTDSSVYTPRVKNYYFDWGKDSTEIIVSRYGSRDGLVIIHLHDDEISSAEAAKKILLETGGILIELENNGERLVSFKKGGKKFQFDPNRIFTAKGRSQNLHYMNKTVTPAALNSVKKFAAFILQKIPKSVVTLVAVHNNQNGSYSINSYRSSTTKDVLKWYKNPKRDPDNFFIVNNNEMFKGIKKRGFNAVLQNSMKAIDDGSLSIYYGKKNLVYVNIETQRGNTEEQIKMLHVLFGILR